MHRVVALALLITAALVASCVATDQPTAPQGNWQKPGWSWEPLGTGGWDPGCEQNGPQLAGSGVRPMTSEECTPTPILYCSDYNPERGAFIGCSVTVSPISGSTTWEVTWWQFLGGGQLVADTNIGSDWQGQMVLSGTITARVEIDGVPWSPDLTASITVAPRSWSWATTIHGQTGGVNDGCLTSADAGLSTSIYCTRPGDFQYIFNPKSSALANGNGYTATEVPSGPNKGLWYVTTPSATMQVGNQLNIEWRVDGPAHAVTGNSTVQSLCQTRFGNTNSRSVYEVNLYCDSAATSAIYNQFTSFVWQHENQHVDTLVAAAQSPTGDVWARWEPIVSNSAAGLLNVVAPEYENARSYVYNRSSTLDPPQHAGTWLVWRYSSGWFTYQIP